jgi:hypothetical protein
MPLKILIASLTLSIAFLVTGCSDSSSDSDSASNSENQSASNLVEEPTFRTRTESFLDGPGGNLWKPVSENNGNIVVLFNPTYRKTFSGGCTVELKDGSFAPLYCGGALNCFTNPNRLTLRSNVRCGSAKEVKVVCNDVNETVIFTVPQELRNQVCGRHD